MEEIKENSKPEEWNNTPGYLTPAEDISRDLQGPEFLWWPESHWSKAGLTNIPDEELELKHESHVLPVTQSLQYLFLRLAVAPADVLFRLLTSSFVWNTLIVRIAWLVRFIQFLSSRKTVRKGRLIFSIRPICKKPRISNIRFVSSHPVKSPVWTQYSAGTQLMATAFWESKGVRYPRQSRSPLDTRTMIRHIYNVDVNLWLRQ